MLKKLLSWGSLLFSLFSCQKDPDETSSGNQNTSTENDRTLPRQLFNYANPSLPAFLNSVPVVSIKNISILNPITGASERIERVLFRRKHFSASNIILRLARHNTVGFFASELRNNGADTWQYSDKGLCLANGASN